MFSQNNRTTTRFGHIMPIFRLSQTKGQTFYILKFGRRDESKFILGIFRDKQPDVEKKLFLYDKRLVAYRNNS